MGGEEDTHSLALASARLDDFRDGHHYFGRAVVYATFRFTSISMFVAAIGFFVSLAAVLVEILFELVYARN